MPAYRHTGGADGGRHSRCNGIGDRHRHDPSQPHRHGVSQPDAMGGAATHVHRLTPTLGDGLGHAHLYPAAEQDGYDGTHVDGDGKRNGRRGSSWKLGAL